jgi:ATPase involved in DNA replication initiation
MDTWQQILKFVEGKISRQNFQTWFKPTQFEKLDENDLCVKVPNHIFEEWLSRHYSKLLQEALENSDLANVKIRFNAEGNSFPRKESTTPVQTSLNFDSVEYLLNPKYTFDRFVVASCN